MGGCISCVYITYSKGIVLFIMLLEGRREEL